MKKRLYQWVTCISSLDTFVALNHILNLAQQVTSLFILLIKFCVILWICRNQVFIYIFYFLNLFLKFASVFIKEISLLKPSLIGFINLLDKPNISLLICQIAFNFLGLKFNYFFKSIFISKLLWNLFTLVRTYVFYFIQFDDFLFHFEEINTHFINLLSSLL